MLQAVVFGPPQCTGFQLAWANPKAGKSGNEAVTFLKLRFVLDY